MKDRRPERRNQTSSWLRNSNRIAAASVMALGLVVACGDETPPVSSRPPAVVLPISGMYEVSGVTVDLESGEERKISGTVILKEDGSAYTATFDLDTLFPTQHGNLEAEVIGNGSGTIDGRTLTGIAETQVIVSTVPGIDPRFAFIPRTTTKRIVSKSVTTVEEDGSVNVKIESTPAEGEDYSPTRTTLKGTRVGDAAI